MTSSTRTSPSPRLCTSRLRSGITTTRTSLSLGLTSTYALLLLTTPIYPFLKRIVIEEEKLTDKLAQQPLRLARLLARHRPQHHPPRSRPNIHPPRPRTNLLLRALRLPRTPSLPQPAPRRHHRRLPRLPRRHQSPVQAQRPPNRLPRRRLRRPAAGRRGARRDAAEPDRRG